RRDESARAIDPPPLDAHPLDAEPLVVQSLDAEPLHAEPLHAEPLHAESLHAEPLHAESLLAGFARRIGGGEQDENHDRGAQELEASHGRRPSLLSLGQSAHTRNPTKWFCT